MPRNEQQTRFQLIDPMLLDHRGWRREDISVEETAAPVDIVYGKGNRRPKGRTDYVLRHPLRPETEPIPLAILEAKHEGVPPGHGLQQGKGYLVGHLHHVPFVLSSNGHQFVEYDESTGITSEPRPMSVFPTPDELVARYLAATAMPPENKDWSLLLTPYAKGRDYLRYYQDAAIRATQFSDTGPAWLIHLPPPSVKVLRAIVRQFERAGTDGLETNELWQTPDIRHLNGLKALREGGDPTDLLRKLKKTLFAA